MKITEKTTIGDLIPEGYEFVNAESAQAYSEEEGGVTVFTLNARKKQKDFDLYFEDYKNKTMDNTFQFKYGTVTNPTKLPWEYRVGLLKFICDDFGVDFVKFIGYLKDIYDIRLEGLNSFPYTNVLHTCPDEFLKSVVND